MPKNIYLVTHAQAEHHLTKKAGGWYDSQLTEVGRQQAIKIGEWLAERNKGVPIYSSDLARAKQTAAMMNHSLGSTIVLDERLREKSVGIAEGKDQNWFYEHCDPVDHNNRLDHRIIEGSETIREFATRIYAAVQPAFEHERSIICTHGFAATFVIAAWLEIPIEHVGKMNFTVNNGTVTILHEDDFFCNRTLLDLNLAV